MLNKMGLSEEAGTCMAQAKTMRQRANDEAVARNILVHAAAGERAAARAARPPKPAPTPVEPLDLLLVSGLPRSGTSLMMQILQAGGQRAADEDNPEGYGEWEKIKTLPKDPGILTATVSITPPESPPW